MTTRLVFPVLALLLVFLAAPPAQSAPSYQRSVEKYTMPDVILVNQNGEKVRFKDFMESGKPVVVDFIYGTCTTICPILSAGYANLQKKLGPDSGKIRLVSITIDPENDTPQVMKDYLKRYRAKPGWDFLTGSRKDINAVMKSFNAFFQNKMDHQPINFIRSADGKWVRLYGYMGSRDFIEECRKAGIN